MAAGERDGAGVEDGGDGECILIGEEQRGEETEMAGVDTGPGPVGCVAFNCTSYTVYLLFPFSSTSRARGMVTVHLRWRYQRGKGGSMLDAALPLPPPPPNPSPLNTLEP